MGKPQSVRDCKTARDFGRVVERQGGYVEHGKRHDIARPSDGRGGVAIPRHDGDLATGTRHSIARALGLLGFLLIMFACCAGVMFVAFEWRRDRATSVALAYWSVTPTATAALREAHASGGSWGCAGTASVLAMIMAGFWALL